MAEIRAIHHKWKQWDHKSLCTYSEFLHINCSLEVIREIGLDVHGELSDFLSVDPSETVPPALSIKVINPQEARKYINIGVHLGTDIPRIPSTLEEAAAAFGKLSALITSTRSVVEIEAKIAETHDGYTIWTLEREKFRVETRERYREVLIDMAMEEKVISMPHYLPTLVPWFRKLSLTYTSCLISARRSARDCEMHNESFCPVYQERRDMYFCE